MRCVEKDNNGCYKGRIKVAGWCMDSKVLKHFLKIVQLGSLTAAADDACLTVQALAAQIKKLEQHMGLRLLNRTNKAVSLTP
ncbi:LysR family transcriptional regulator [Candidatus Symbiopectobacterium sp. 'North America']|uniref:helix-turn-helix domain-containing protein n=1 Tax=Candidatus Symbiopectobacterium sp. 'North America' TaxID=2794574 RepID=UPI0018CB0242|nr:LysR family transcriptional regulator [Candidatus Symbiopectobacterium sp. 'North America']